jgi:hypothetical protein
MNKKVAVLAVLMVVVVVLVARALFFSGPPDNYQYPSTSQPGAAPASPAATGSAATPAVATAGQPLKPAGTGVDVNIDELAKNVQVVEFQYDPATLARNPMTPLVGPQAVLAAATGVAGETGASASDTDLLTQQMAVTGIIWDKKFPVAVINNDVVAQGDVLSEGIVVKTIEADKVILAVRDRAVTLPLKRLEEQ